VSEQGEGARAGGEHAIALFAEGWNAGDAGALARAFHDDATFVNRFGRLVRGREAIAAMHAPLFQSVYRGSVASYRIEETSLLADAVAYACVRLDLKTGDAMPGGATEIPGRMQIVVTRRQESWRIQAAANIAMVDPITGLSNPNL
jgi:uncharacterized protein (TIGR02246 family)